MAGKSRRTWGSVVPKHKGSVRRFYVEYTGPDGKRHTAGTSFQTSQDCDAWLVAEKRLIERGDWTPPAERRRRARHEDMSVGEWLKQYHEYLLANGRRLTTVQHYRRTVANRVTGTALDRMPVNRVRPENVAAWWQDTTKKYPDTPTTNHKAYKALRAAFQKLVDDESTTLTDNPVRVAEAARKPKPKGKELPEREELDAIVEHLPDRYKLAGALCLHHGLRVGEALGLKRKHVVIRERDGVTEVDIRVRGNVQRVADDGGRTVMVWQDTKTDAGRREVPLLPEFVDLLRKHLDEFSVPGPEGWLTPTREGSVVFDTSFRSVFNRARSSAGVRDDLTLHHGRNYLITALAERGATPAEIGAILGQDDLKTIVETYMKVRPSRPRELMTGL